MKGKSSPGGTRIEGVHKTAARKGQTIVESGPPDRSTPGTPAATKGTFGGSTTNLSHSLTGTSANQSLDDD